MPPTSPTHSATNLWFGAQLVEWGTSLLFNDADVLADLAMMAAAFPNPDMHFRAVIQIDHQLRVIAKRQPGAAMRGRLAGWRRHAFQSDPHARGFHADLRIVYRLSSHGELELFGFGHRRIPLDLYARLRSRPVPP